MCQFGKTIIDNRDNVKPFYDDASMGGGFIEFPCSNCQKTVKKEATQKIKIKNRSRSHFKQ